MVFFVTGCATDSFNFALGARVRFRPSDHFSTGVQVSYSKQLAPISLEALTWLSACPRVLRQVLRRQKHDKIARTSEHEEDRLSHILRAESFTRRRARLGFARIGNAPKFIQDHAWAHGSEPLRLGASGVQLLHKLLLVRSTSSSKRIADDHYQRQYLYPSVFLTREVG